MEANEDNTLMILSPVWTPARIAAPSGQQRREKALKQQRESREMKQTWMQWMQNV